MLNLYEACNYLEKMNQILSLSDSNGIQTHNHLVRKRIFNHLTKLAIITYSHIFC